MKQRQKTYVLDTSVLFIVAVLALYVLICNIL